MIKVLIAEDNVPISVHLSNVVNFTKEAQAISIVNNGKEVYSMIKSLKPDVVILDLKLPGEDGLEILQKINSDKEIKTQVIIYSGDLNYIAQVRDFDFVVRYLSKSQPCEEIGIEIKKIAKWISHDKLEKNIYDILLKMGFHAEHKGTQFIKDCILISAEENNENLKEIYDKISKIKRTTTYTIKADIQSAVNKMWRYANKEKVRKLLRLADYESPSTKRVVSMVKYYIERKDY